MFNEPDTPARAQQREHAEPSEGLRPVPLVASVITLAVVIFGAGYIFLSESFGRSDLGDQRTLADLSARPPGTAGGQATTAVDGSQVFTANCVACHQANGQGIPGAFPTLDDSEWVEGNELILVNILLHGISGEITVAGKTYNGAMPGFSRLTDAELAAVATHIRSAWSNQSAAISPERVARARRDLARTTPFNGEAELRTLAESDPGGP